MTDHEQAITTTAGPQALIRPVAGTHDIAVAFQEYRELSERILEDSDRMTIAGRSFTKRSGWRKLATAYGVSFEIRDTSLERLEDGRILRAQVQARAIAPNGRYADGIGIADRSEKCCANPCRIRASRHQHCPAAQGQTCTLAHFSNAEHDIPATASTRALNRAAADLFGLGEVSAEEITREEEHEPEPRPAAARRSQPADAPPEAAEASTPEHHKAIRDLAAATGHDLDKIVAAWGASRLEDLDAAQARGTIARLEEIQMSQAADNAGLGPVHEATPEAPEAAQEAPAEREPTSAQEQPRDPASLL